MSSFSRQAMALCCPKDNPNYYSPCIPDRGEPACYFQYAGQSAISAHFDCSKSICPKHHFYENDSFLHRSISYKLSLMFLISLPEMVLLFK